jgi:hypothetical protein
VAHDATQVAAVGDVQTKFNVSYHAMDFFGARCIFLAGIRISESGHKENIFFLYP